jgi:hypothetical protein
MICEHKRPERESPEGTAVERTFDALGRLEIVQEESEGRCPHQSTVERILEEDLTLAGRRLSTADPPVELNHVA